MGDPRFPRKRYDRPAHPWRAERIKEENELIKKYGLKNKREVWKVESYLRRTRRAARLLQTRLRTKDPQAEKEMKGMIGRLAQRNLLKPDATLDDVLALDLNSILEQRFQTKVYQKGLSSTIRQARQLIVQGHCAIGGRRVTVPGYPVKKGELDSISYNPSSPFNNELHPMRPRPEAIPSAPTDDGAAGKVPQKPPDAVSQPPAQPEAAPDPPKGGN